VLEQVKLDVAARRARIEAEIAAAQDARAAALQKAVGAISDRMAEIEDRIERIVKTDAARRYSDECNVALSASVWGRRGRRGPEVEQEENSP
jgi:hypothetical protein